MDEATNEFLQKLATESQGRLQAMDQLTSSADASKVFGQPITSGEFTVITASEVASGGGFGSGMGFGLPRVRRSEGSEEQGGLAGTTAEGAGGGGGGGGGSMGRPVAAIIITPDRVQIRPLLDVTKVSLVALMAFSAMGILALKLLKKR